MSVNVILLQRLKQIEHLYGYQVESRVTTERLSEALYCSTRNIAKLMKTLSSVGWIQWQAGRGRGNLSKLTVIQSFHSVLSEQLKEMVSQGKIEDAYRYADTFKYTHVFKVKLSEWLDDTHEAFDKLISLTPYTLPKLHPMHMVDINAGLYVTAMFDTLITYDSNLDKFIPHLAHQFYVEANTYFFRIHPNVYFHNGELLTPQHVANNILNRAQKPHVASLFYRHVENVEVRMQWVEITLSQSDPLFLHTLADIHSAIFLDNPENEAIPFGTGPYQIQHSEKDHWSLSKFQTYFSHSGIIEQADFWAIDIEENPTSGHLEQVNDGSPTKSDNEFTHCELEGAECLCFHQHSTSLSMEERAWIKQNIKRILKDTPNNNPAYSLLSHTEVIVEEEMTVPVLPKRSVLIDSSISPDIRQLFEQLQALGLSIKYVDSTEIEAIDIGSQDVLFGNDTTFDYFYWLLVSNMSRSALGEQEQKTLLVELDDKASQDGSAHNLLPHLNEIESLLVNEIKILPLWRKHVTFKTHAMLNGTNMDKRGVMSLKDIWFDRRT
ncbi:SgrR family transcriptional regulator [Vibrio kyushuensis]|uniref:SgrR family transcriptional regulator n=1 Tax=Vibrio kyushuensis TaxID=2910249 RepID=UPI003D0E615C